MATTSERSIPRQVKDNLVLTERPPRGYQSRPLTVENSVEAAAAGTVEARNASTETRDVETRHERFRRLGNARTRKAIIDLRHLGSLGTGRYERRPEDVDKIATILVDEVQKCIHRLRVGMDEPLEDII